jgi:hypothetical protein
MFVWIVVGRRDAGDAYIVGVFGSEQLAREHAARWQRQHVGGSVEVQRYAVSNGRATG